MKIYVYTGCIALSILISILLLKRPWTPLISKPYLAHCTEKMLQSYTQNLAQIQKDAHPFGHDLKTWLNIFTHLTLNPCQHQIHYIELKPCEHQPYRICLTSTFSFDHQQQSIS